MCSRDGLAAGNNFNKNWGGKIEEANINALRGAFGRLDPARMRHDPRHGRGYTEPRKSD